MTTTKQDFFALRKQLYGERDYCIKVINSCVNYLQLCTTARQLSMVNVPQRWDFLIQRFTDTHAVGRYRYTTRLYTLAHALKRQITDYYLDKSDQLNLLQQ